MEEIAVSQGYIHKGRLFKAISTSSTTSHSSVQVNIPHPIVLFKAVLTSPMRHSNCPPHKAARLRLNCHLMFSCAQQSCVFSSRIICLSHFSALTKVLPLSEYIFSGRPQCAMSCFKLLGKSLVARFGSTSRNSPCGRLHAHNARQAFPSVLALIRYLMGPAKSAPITSNGVLPSVRSVDRSPGGGVASAIA